jgi:RNA polymerase sigma-70 factor, ECF subfamily
LAHHRAGVSPALFLALLSPFVPSSIGVPSVQEHIEPGDEELMERAARGDRDAFAALVRRHQGPVLSIAFRFLGSRADAEDAAQEVFLRVWGAARRYRPERPLAAYLRTLTVNFCLDQKRKARFRVLSGDVEPTGSQDPHGEVETSERSRTLSRALSSLPPAQRMAVVLFHMEGLSVKEVSGLMDASPKAVESLLTRARSALKARLAGLLGHSLRGQASEEG